MIIGISAAGAVTILGGITCIVMICLVARKRRTKRKTFARLREEEEVEYNRFAASNPGPRARVESEQSLTPTTVMDHNLAHGSHNDKLLHVLPEPAPSISVNHNAAYIPTPDIPVETNAAYVPTPSIPVETNTAYVPTPSIPVKINAAYNKAHRNTPVKTNAITPSILVKTKTNVAYLQTPNIPTGANVSYVPTPIVPVLTGKSHGTAKNEVQRYTVSSTPKYDYITDL